MDNKKVSIIIPVYNVAEYLRRCLSSVLEQTYKNIEIILIDDGSTDGSGAICDEYAQDDRFRILHVPNGGQARARNKGLDMATGDYVCFVDSDDRIKSNMVSYCLDRMEAFQADAVLFDCLMSEHIEGGFPDRTEKTIHIEGNEIMRFFMREATHNSKLFSLCLCCYKRSVLGELRFREGKIYEDNDFKYRFMNSCRSVVVSNQVLYFYYVSGNSTTSGKLGRKNLQLREADAIIYRLTQQNPDPDVQRYGRIKKARTAFSWLGRMARYGVNEQEIDETELVAELMAEHRKNLPTLLGAPIGLKRKLLALLLAFSYPLSKKILSNMKSVY